MALTQEQTPQTFLAEQAVIGCMLRDSSLVPKILAAVDEEDFGTDPCRRAYQAARSLFRAGSPVDPITIRNELGAESGRWLAELMDLTPSPSAWEDYAQLMHEQAALRRIQDYASGLLQAVRLEDCREAVQGLADVFAGGRKIDAWTLQELLTDFAQRQGQPEGKEYISFGIERLDQGTYVEHGDVVMIGGAPSDGKTAFALTVAWHMAKRHNVGFFSLETGREKLEDRLVTSGFGIDFGRIKRNSLTDDDWLSFARKMPSASERRLTVIRSAGMTAEQIAGISRARGFDVIFIDYVQLITPVSVRGASRAEQMAEVSRTLHTFAQTSGTLVVELAQLTRQERGSKRERDMFDLGESSQFEKDADLILLLYRPIDGTHLIEGDRDSELLDPEKHRILRVAKNKEGMRVRLPLAFDGAHQSFAVLVRNDGREVMRQLVDKGKKVKNQRTPGQLSLREIPEAQDMPF